MQIGAEGKGPRLPEGAEVEVNGIERFCAHDGVGFVGASWQRGVGVLAARGPGSDAVARRGLSGPDLNLDSSERRSKLMVGLMNMRTCGRAKACGFLFLLAASGCGEANDAAVEALADVPVAPGCPTGLAGPPMVEVTTPKGAKYCIDSREVSQADYFEFLSTYLEDPSTSHELKEGMSKWPFAPGCELSTSLTPDYTSDAPCSTTPEAFSRKSEYPNNPVTCVDWCNAWSYCLWARKRLCGAVGGAVYSAADATNPEVSEYFNVCSQGGKTTYAYGNEYRSDLISASDISYYPSDGQAKRPATSVDGASECHGSTPPFDAVVNVGCNVAEWQDACRPTQYEALCVVAGISPGEKPKSDGSRCDAHIETGIAARGFRTGFRCCHD